MDHHQSNLMIEDTLRVEITRNIGITNRAVGICAGSNPVTEWEHIVDCIHNPTARLVIPMLRVISTRNVSSIIKFD
jgi:hypothetical protein